MTRIMSIEDDPDVQHLISSALFKEKYDIHYAWNGQEGYEKILALRPALILLDLMLPILNGVDVLKKLQENKATRDIPVIIVTSYGDEADMLKYAVQVLGAACYLRKPFVPNELVAAIKQVLVRFPSAESGRPPAPAAKELKKGCLRADKSSLTVWIDDRLVATLPDKEFALLEHLIKSPRQATKTALLSAMGYAASQNDALKQAVHRLRRALGPAERRRIKTTKSGYELVG
ncbi:MAG TPA: response regulator transcription factor [Elusimicrobiota bacterium]|nr:response regulator transcription factor [Elusimicrobiota bacterium]